MSRLKGNSWLLISVFAFHFSNAFCQAPYAVKSPHDYVLSGATMAVSFTGFLLSENKHRLSHDEIVHLNSNEINIFDRSAVNHYSKGAAKTSDVLLFSSLATPLLLLTDKNVRDHGLQTGILYFETVVVASVGVNLSKGLFSRPRPYVYNQSVPESEKQKNDATNSFFSGHTAMSAAGTFFAAKIFCDTHTDSKWKPAAWIGAAAIPIATGFYRYRAGKHFPTDIIAGYCWGALSGILIPQLHRTWKKN